MRRLCGHSGHVGTPYIYYATHLKSIMKTTLRLTLVGLSCLAMFIAKAAAATVDPPLSDLTSYFTAVSARRPRPLRRTAGMPFTTPIAAATSKPAKTAHSLVPARLSSTATRSHWVPTACSGSYRRPTGPRPTIYRPAMGTTPNGSSTAYGPPTATRVRPRRPTMPTSAFSPSDQSMTVTAMPSRVTS